MAAARAHVAEQLAARGLDRLIPDAELAVSELVTNALLHARGAMSVRVRPTERGARVEVADESELAPVPNPLQGTGMSGRGLLLVARVTAGWGSEPMGHGKEVWFEVRADHVPPTTCSPGGTSTTSGPRAGPTTWRPATSC
ncbi:MAG: ATP-binding protein [Frankiaceae bacterium]